ncbi:hypothetical protein [Rhizobium leguminosarum]|uniref:hypothetical protein n=1 Tax=Rhizobium leguminosarum TaxID=384 RepID=UPI003F9DBECE
MTLLEIMRLCQEWTLTEATIDGHLDEAAEDYRKGKIPLSLYLATITSLLQNFCGNTPSIRANRALHDIWNLRNERDLRSGAAACGEFWYFVEAIDIRLDKSIARDVELFPRFVNEMIALSTDVADGPLYAILGMTRVWALSDIIVDYVASMYLKARLYGDSDRRFHLDLLERVQERLEGRSLSHSRKQPLENTKQKGKRALPAGDD